MLKVELGLDFWRASCLWRKKIELSFVELGITHPQFIVLYHLSRYCDQIQNQKDLALAAGIDVATLSQIVRLLEKRNLLKRRHFKGDERAKHLKLTTEGLAILSSAIEKYHQANLNFFNPKLLNPVEFQANLLKLISS